MWALASERLTVLHCLILSLLPDERLSLAFYV